MTVQVMFGTRANRIGAAIGAIAFAALAAAPFWGGRDDLQLLAEIYAYIALASLWNLFACSRRKSPCLAAAPARACRRRS